jgi:hypothetical protein
LQGVPRNTTFSSAPEPRTARGSPSPARASPSSPSSRTAPSCGTTNPPCRAAGASLHALIAFFAHSPPTPSGGPRTIPPASAKGELKEPHAVAPS